jgi:RecB family exonuclease
VISPRATRLISVPDTATFRQALLDLSLPGTVADIRRRAVLVPSRAAAEQLRRSLEDHALERPASDGGTFGNGGGRRALAIPHLLTRDDWVVALEEALAPGVRKASALEREVLLRAAAGAAVAGGARPPFTLRPGLMGEMLRFYDGVRRHGRTVDDLERVAVDELEQAAASDRGAARLLDETRFLVAAFRGYESRLADAGLSDEHVLRRALIAAPSTAFSHIIVAVGDRAGDPSGLWPSDFDFLTRAAGLSRLDVVATVNELAAGLLVRLRTWLPGMEETAVTPAARDAPRLLAPAGSQAMAFWRARDREEELADVARRIKRGHRTDPAAPLQRTAVVFKRPLPYVYLARQIFKSARLPYQTFDALPLAAEPFAVAVDLVFEVVESSLSRSTLTGLLRSPLLRFTVDGRPVHAGAVALLDRKLSEARYLAEPAGLARLASEWHAPTALHTAAQAAAAVADELGSLVDEGPPSRHLDTVLRFLAAHERLPRASHPARERHLRGRSAVLSALARLRDAHARFADTPCAFSDTSAAIRRWIEQQTFAPRDGSTGVQFLDADAARFGDFDTVHLVGLTEREWPEGAARSIFYPASMLANLGWPGDTDARAAERARFDDLLRSAARFSSVSTITLEDDATIGPSPYLDDLVRCGLEIAREPASTAPRVFVSEAILQDPQRADALDETPAAWLALRRSRTSADDGRFHGRADPAPASKYPVSAIDKFLACPFVYFAERVLRLAEEPEDEAALDPKAQGRLVHAVLEEFFNAWQRRGRGSVTIANLDEARELFAAVAATHLAALSPVDAALLRARLLGSPVAEGVGDIVLAAEAERDRGVPIVERLLEFPLDGDTRLGAGDAARTVRLAAKADRIDLFADGTFRVIDYKLSRAPNLKHVVQLPAYAAAARERLDGRQGRSWRPSDAAYLALGKGDHYEPLAATAEGTAAALAAGEARLVDAVGRIEQGSFPPAPAEPHRCRYCPFSSVCRKDYVGDE